MTDNSIDLLYLQTLRQYLQSEIGSIVTTDCKDEKTYRMLRDLLLCRIALFNARRGGECATLRLDEMEPLVQSGADYNLTELEHKLLER